MLTSRAQAMAVVVEAEARTRGCADGAAGSVVTAMPVYEYRDYQVDKDLVATVVARVQRVSEMLSCVVDELGAISAQAVGGDGDVVLSVNADGQLTSLSLAQGCATRYTPLALTELINTTIDEAVTIANRQAASLGGQR